MRKVRIDCVGISPLLFDKMTDETLDGLITGVRPSKPKDRPNKDVAREKIYRKNGKEGPIGIPSEMLFACLVNAGRNVKMGKKQISTADSTSMPDFMSLTDFFMPLTNISSDGNDDGSWEVDKRRGVLDNGGKKVAVGLVRPRFDKWEFSFEIEYDEAKVDESTIRALFNNAGSAQGLGAFRPNCRGPFGRFKVAKWELLKKDELASASQPVAQIGDGKDVKKNAA